MSLPSDVNFGIVYPKVDTLWAVSRSYAQALVAKISRHMLVIFNVYNSKQALPSGKTHEVLNPPSRE